MKKKYNIILIIIISFFATSCKKENSPISPIFQETSIEGLWNENFYGLSEFELVIKNNHIYEPDSIIRIANLKIEEDSFKVIVNQIYFLSDTILLANQKELGGTYKFKNDSIVTFIDSLDINEDYLFKREENMLRLNYYLPKTDSIIVWIPPGVGLPWGRCMLKYGGVLTRIK